MKKESVQTKEYRKDIRMDERTWSKINWLARTYAGGNVTKWLIYAALNVDRKWLVDRKKVSR